MGKKAFLIIDYFANPNIFPSLPIPPVPRLRSPAFINCARKPIVHGPPPFLRGFSLLAFPHNRFRSQNGRRWGAGPLVGASCGAPAVAPRGADHPQITPPIFGSFPLDEQSPKPFLPWLSHAFLLMFDMCNERCCNPNFSTETSFNNNSNNNNNNNINNINNINNFFLLSPTTTLPPFFVHPSRRPPAVAPPPSLRCSPGTGLLEAVLRPLQLRPPPSPPPPP